MMRAPAICVFLLSAALGAAADESASAVGHTRDVIVIPISGNVDPGMAAFISRAVRQATEQPNPLIVLEMDTFGGRVDAALQIVDTLSGIPQDRTIAFVKNRAISAGSLIALSCGKLVMKHNTTIGDCAPISFSNEGPKMLGEKFQSPLRAKFRALAKRNDYPVTLAEAMVTAEMTVLKVVLPDTTLYMDSLEFAELSSADRRRVISRKTIVAPGELLTMDNIEAEELGFSTMSTGSVEEMLTRFYGHDYRLVRVDQNWSEQFVRFIGAISPVLMLIGFAALYAELKAPGFGVAGIIGVACLALVFAGQYMAGLANYTELLLLMFGVALLAAEIFVIPGFGIAGIAGIALMAVGMILSFQDFVIPRPEMPWQRELLERNLLVTLSVLVGSFGLLLLFIRYLFPHISRVVSGPYLEATLSRSHVDSDKSSPVSIGDVGTVTKPLRPSGSARFESGVYDIVADGEFVEKNVQVVVTSLEGNRIVVSRESGDE